MPGGKADLLFFFASTRPLTSLYLKSYFVFKNCSTLSIGESGFAAAPVDFIFALGFTNTYLLLFKTFFNEAYAFL